MELNVYDGTVRDIIFTEDSVNRSTVFMSGGAAPILGLYTWGSGLFVNCSQDKTVRFWDLRLPQAINVVTANNKTASQVRSASTMQTPKEWNIESLLGELVESSDRDNMADSDTVEYAINRRHTRTANVQKSLDKHLGAEGMIIEKAPRKLKPRNLFADMTPPPDESAPAYSKEVANAEGESAFVGTVNGNHDYPHFKQQFQFAFRLLVANFSSSQLDRFECYRRSSFPRRKIRKVYATLCPQILLLYVCDICDGLWAVHYLQEEGGEWKTTGFGRLIHRFTRQTASDNVVIAVAGLAKLFVGDLAEEALDIQNRMNEGNEPLKPHHIDFAYEALRGKGLLFPIKPRRSPFLYMLHTVLACPQVLNPGITRHVGRKDFWMRKDTHQSSPRLLYGVHCNEFRRIHICPEDMTQA
ncbi:unnamed protein product [Toxocara canis]|uniref:TAFII28 domain-containing protein n=1 Tax=Toxocara canis TaxID=6265 RepID=A0A183UV53_TOXCA|nr:unnamed protein product [Toxocara canis]